MSGDRPDAASRRPFRFGLSTANEFAQVARRAEAHGYATLLVADHLGGLAPIPAAVAAAAATDHLRVGTFVLNNDFRHPGILAQEVATADLLSGGRFELGMGAGFMRAEYEAVGLGFDPALIRIDRLEEAAPLLKRLLAGETVTHEGRFYRFADHRLSPLPPQGALLPLLVGGNGDRLLSVAARLADTVGFTGFSPRKGGTEPTTTHFTAEGLADRIAYVRGEAGERFDELELNVLVQRVVVTGDRRTAARDLAGRLPGRSADELLDSPFLLIGTPAQIAEQLREYQERFRVTYWVVFDGERSDGFDGVVEELAGT